MAPTITFGRISEIDTRTDVYDLAYLLGSMDRTQVSDGLIHRNLDHPDRALVVELAQRLIEVAHLLPDDEATRATRIGEDILGGGDIALAGHAILDPDLYTRRLSSLLGSRPPEGQLSARWRATPDDVFPDMPTLWQLKPNPDRDGQLLTRDGLETAFTELSEVVYHERGDYGDEQWWQVLPAARMDTVLAIIANIQGTLDEADRQHREFWRAVSLGEDVSGMDSPLLSRREIACAERVLAALVYGETVGGSARGAWAAVVDLDRYRAWQHDRHRDPVSGTRLDLRGQQIAAELAELDRLYGLPDTTSADIDYRSGHFAAAPGLKPLPAAEYVVLEQMDPAQLRGAVRELIGQAVEGPRPGAVGADDLEVLSERASALLQQFISEDWSNADYFRARVLLASIAGREDATLRRGAASLLAAITDHQEFVEFLQARNEPHVQEWTEEVESLISPREFESVTTWVNPIAEGEAVLRADEFAADRAAAPNTHTLIDKELSRFQGLSLITLSPLEAANTPVWRYGDFRHALDALDAPDLSEQQLRRGIATVVNTVRRGWHLNREQAARAEVLLAARDHGNVPVPAPRLWQGIYNGHRFGRWQLQREAVQHAAEYIAATRTQELDPLLRQWAHIKTEQDATTLITAINDSSVDMGTFLLAAAHHARPEHAAASQTSPGLVVDTALAAATSGHTGMRALPAASETATATPDPVADAELTITGDAGMGVA